MAETAGVSKSKAIREVIEVWRVLFRKRSTEAVASVLLLPLALCPLHGSEGNLQSKLDLS